MLMFDHDEERERLNICLVRFILCRHFVVDVCEKDVVFSVQLVEIGALRRLSGDVLCSTGQGQTISELWVFWRCDSACLR